MFLLEGEEMNNTNTGGPAFPGLHPSSECRYKEEGMTLRDYFAAKAMEAWILATTKPYMHDGKHQVEMLDVDRLAEYAYKQSNAMLKAREACETR